MIAYHATTKDNKSRILDKGFDPDKLGEKGSHFGIGVYLATTKSLARQYGKHVITVAFDEQHFYHLKDWLKAYQTKCKEVYAAGIPADDVNTVVGAYYKDLYTAQGYTGLIIDGIVGTTKEIVIYDTNVIHQIYT